jgi:hypothetical protein
VARQFAHDAVPPRFLSSVIPEHRGQWVVSLAGSAVLHSAVFFLLGSVSGDLGRVASSEDMRAVFPAHADRVIWYDFRKPRLPKLSSSSHRGVAQAPDLAAHSVVSRPPDAPRTPQIIWHRVRRPRTQRQFDQANTVILEPAPPQRTSPAPKQPKAFVAPPSRSIPAAAPQFETLPRLAAVTDIRRAVAPVQPLPHAPKPTLRNFVAPKLRMQTAAAVRVVDSLPELNARPTVPAGAAPPPASTASLPKPQPRAFVAPPAQRRTAGGSEGRAQVMENLPDVTISDANSPHTAAAVILSASPGARINASVPEASRQGQLGSASVRGSLTPGGGDDAVAQVPNISVSGSPTLSKPQNVEGAPMLVPGAGARPARPREITLPVAAPTFAAPLHASNRTLPAVVDRVFAQRVVYAVVIPIERIPGYGGDWIMWFAERDPVPGAAPHIRPPAPFRKEEVEGATHPPMNSRVQLAATIRQNGRVEGVRSIGAQTAGQATVAVADLQCWQFRPAMRNGIPIDVDVVLEVAIRQ